MNKNRSVDYSFVGAGEGGGRIAATFGRMGYVAGAINTSSSDLDGLKRLPASHRLHIHTGLGVGGAGRDPSVGRDAVLAHEVEIRDFMRDLVSQADHVMLCVGGGGGTGTGSMGDLARILIRDLGRPVGIIYTLPGDEGTSALANSVRGLRGLYQLAEAGSVSPLVLVDNARVEELFPEVSVGHLWGKINQHIADVWDSFNRLSTRRGWQVATLDSMDYYLNVVQAGKCASLGRAIIQDLKSPLALKRGVSEAMASLVRGYDLATASAIGVIVIGSEGTLNHLPKDYLGDGFRAIESILSGGHIVRGVYADERYRHLHVYVFASGLDLPARVHDLAAEAQVQMNALREKMSQRSDPLDMDFLENNWLGLSRQQQGNGNGLDTAFSWMDGGGGSGRRLPARSGLAALAERKKRRGGR